MNKVVFISGASSGFGEAIARKFAELGQTLILVARREKRLSRIANELSKITKVYWCVLDIRDKDAVNSCISELPDYCKNIDILVNNAGLALGVEGAPNCNVDDWETMIDTNIKGLTYLTRSVLPKMIERDSGHIINIGSIAANWPYPGGNTYCGTKAFVEQFSRCLRADLLGKKIKVSCVSPGMAETDFSIVRMSGDELKAKEVYKNTTPLTASDIAAILAWLVCMPEHVNINAVEVMPICQAWGPLSVSRDMQ